MAALDGLPVVGHKLQVKLADNDAGEPWVCCGQCWQGWLRGARRLCAAGGIPPATSRRGQYTDFLAARVFVDVGCRASC